MTIIETMQKYHVSRGTVENWIKQGKIKIQKNFNGRINVINTNFIDNIGDNDTPPDYITSKVAYRKYGTNYILLRRWAQKGIIKTHKTISGSRTFLEPDINYICKGANSGL